MAVCVGCGTAVQWRFNDKTRARSPVNITEDPTGNVVLVGTSEYHVLTKKEKDELDNPGLFPPDPVTRYTLHFATCDKPQGFADRDPKQHKAPRGNHGRRH